MREEQEIKSNLLAKFEPYYELSNFYFATKWFNLYQLLNVVSTALLYKFFNVSLRFIKFAKFTVHFKSLSEFYD